MRCIEIIKEKGGDCKVYPINKNMRCIEICIRKDASLKRFTINKNMRCIEILNSKWGQDVRTR